MSSARISSTAPVYSAGSRADSSCSGWSFRLNHTPSGFAVRVTVPVSFASVCRQYSLRARKISSQASARPAAPFSLEHWAAT